MQAVMFPFPSAFVDMGKLALPGTTCCENTIYTDREKKSGIYRLRNRNHVKAREANGSMEKLYIQQRIHQKETSLEHFTFTDRKR